MGQPASAKSLFLLGILELEHKAVYYDGSNTTNRILDVLERERPKVILIDELDLTATGIALFLLIALVV
ncbi:MAG: hypothetical protein WA323_05245 [Candidatus Nitrosopolaris sp.]